MITKVAIFLCGGPPSVDSKGKVPPFINKFLSILLVLDLLEDIMDLFFYFIII